MEGLGRSSLGWPSPNHSSMWPRGEGVPQRPKGTGPNGHRQDSRRLALVSLAYLCYSLICFLKSALAQSESGPADGCVPRTLCCPVPVLHAGE